MNQPIHDRYIHHLQRLPGVDETVASDLLSAGLRTVKQVDAATEDQLTKASGKLTKAKAKAIKDHITARKAKRRGKKVE
jgi:Helix-hairpin-helix domain